MRASDFETYDRKKLDSILSKLCDLIIKGQQSDKDYGMVAAAVLDPDNRIVLRLNYPGKNGRVHAERAAMEAYISKYGEIPRNSIVVTTLSPCSEKMNERDGPSCTDYINSSPVKNVYYGYQDPTQEDDHRGFDAIETKNSKIRNRCKAFADTFLDKIS